MPSTSKVRQARLEKKAAAAAANASAESKVTSDFVPQEGKITATQKIEEIERRNEVVQQVKASHGQNPFSTSVPGSGEDNDFSSFEDPTQNFVVVNVAHRGQRPKKDRPAFRLLGAFETAAEANEYIKMAAPQLTGCNMWRVPIQKWMLICKTMERQQDEMYTTSKIELLKSMYLQDQARRDAEFAKNRENREMGATDLSLEAQKKSAQKRKTKKVSSRLKALRSRGQTQGKIQASQDLNLCSSPGTNDVPSHLVRRKQDYAVVSFMKDVSRPVLLGADDPEPSCIVWRFFATYEMAQKWMKGIGARYIRGFDTEIVDNYEWLFPEDVDRDKVQETWRNPEQNKIMMQQKTEPGRVAEFEQWCKSKGLDMPVTEVMADNVPVATNPTELLPTDLEPKIATSAVHLPQKSFEVSVLETKNPDREEIKVLSGDNAADFAYLRRPIVENQSVHHPMQPRDSTLNKSLFPEPLLDGPPKIISSLTEAQDPFRQPKKVNYDAVLKPPAVVDDGTIHAPHD
jgi:hypothetical protein